MHNACLRLLSKHRVLGRFYSQVSSDVQSLAVTPQHKTGHHSALVCALAGCLVLTSCCFCRDVHSTWSYAELALYTPGLPGGHRGRRQRIRVAGPPLPPPCLRSGRQSGRTLLDRQ